MKEKKALHEDLLKLNGCWLMMPAVKKSVQKSAGSGSMRLTKPAWPMGWRSLEDVVASWKKE